VTDSVSSPDPEERRGPIAWMIHNRVTPNLLMLVLMAGGFLMSTQIKQEVFPEFQLDVINVSVSYPGASPAEVEQGILLAIEEAVRGIDDIDEVDATATEGSGQVRLELAAGVDAQRVYQDVQQAVDRIRTFPEDAERPEVSLLTRRREVLTLQIYGDIDEWTLRELAEQVRDALLQDPGITQVDLRGARDFEIHLEVPRENLRAYGLTLQGIADRVSKAAVEVPGGSVKTSAGEILLRMQERRDWAREFGSIPIVTTPQGTVVHLRDIAEVRDGFADTDRVATYDGKRSIGLSVYRVGDQTPIGVSEAVREAMSRIEADLPPGIDYAINHDRSEIYQQRLQLLLKNAFFGLALVFVLLGLFLEFKLAFWVTMGIVTSFVGSFLFLPAMGVTINMISMFAFIVALGIVVDDAIVAGENIYEYRQRGRGLFHAAVLGARDVSLPIGFAILTNIVAFLPLMFVPGFLGKIWFVIPAVVATVFLISWAEALFILPSHLAHTRSTPRYAVTAFLHSAQQRFGRGFLSFVDRAYGPALRACLTVRYLTLAVAVAVFAVVVAYAAGGHMGLILMPKVESDSSVVTAVLPVGSSSARLAAVRDRLVDAAMEVAGENGGDKLSSGVFAVINDNVVEVTTYLTAPDVRPISTTQLTRLWRDRVGTMPGLQSLKFESDRGGPGHGPSVTVQLSHRDVDTLDRAGTDLADRLLGIEAVRDVDSGYTPGKPQLDFRLRNEGRSLGLTAADVARQVRNAFYGSEALRQLRDRNEVKVMVRLPDWQRSSEYDVERLMIRTPGGRDVPLMQIADVTRGRAFSAITRRDGRRTIDVTADVVPLDKSNQVINLLKAEILPQLVRDYPGLAYSFEGHQADLRDALQSLARNFLLALAAIYILLAVPLRSYSQPAVIMISIPFGVVGAVIGHIIMGYSLSIVSMMGIVALSGVVVNDALIMIDYANRQHAAGESIRDAIAAAGIRRFRPIMLTTLTTFGGLAPMIFETSRQARFMIPMAISLGYGILFATVITLLIVPCFYLVLDDIAGFFRARQRPTIQEA
jgi:multidrug efflux pump subunit AcrB